MNRRVKKTIVVLAAMVVFLPIMVLLINSSPFDEPLDPEVARLISDSGISVSDDDNGYYPFLGIYAAADADPGAVGREMVERFNAAKRSGAELPAADGLEGGIEASALEVQGLNKCDRSAADNCLQIIEENKAGIEQIAEQYRQYLQRYEILLGRAGFRETVVPDFRAPLVPNVLPLERLFIAVAYLENGDRPEDFLAALDHDLRFRRMVLANAECLLAKMQSARAILFAAKVLSEYTERHELSKEQVELLSRMLAPLAKEELDISEGFAHEFQMMANAIFDHAHGRGHEGLHGAPRFQNAVNGWLTQPNATVNSVYEMSIRDLMRIAAMPALDFRGMMARIESGEAPATLPGPSWSPYNYGGRKILSAETPDLLACIKTMHDLDNALGRAKSQLRLETGSDRMGVKPGPWISEMNGG